MKRKFLIMAPSYDDNIGGHVVLHKLCHLLNECSVKAYLLPYIDNDSVRSDRKIISIYASFKKYIKRFMPYTTNPEFSTPVLQRIPEDISDPSWVVIYPEVTSGNPIGGKNVVRWFLHQPGFHTGEVAYGSGELHVKYSSAIYDFSFPGCTLSDDYLKVIHYPVNFYNRKGTLYKRSGTAYCLRKGKGKLLVHDVSDSILIDGKSHAEVANIFKHAEVFISYDSLTAYSRFAALCGCTSIVVPDEGVSIDDWYPDKSDRFGISYGFSSTAINEANVSAKLLSAQISKEEKQCATDIIRFLKNVDDHF